MRATFLIMPVILFFTLLSCSKDNDDEYGNPLATYSFTASSTVGSVGLWSIPSYDFNYEGEYNYIIVEATINGTKVIVSEYPSTAGTLYYNIEVYDGGDHHITIYNVEKNGRIPITIRLY